MTALIDFVHAIDNRSHLHLAVRPPSPVASLYTTVGAIHGGCLRTQLLSLKEGEVWVRVIAPSLYLSPKGARRKFDLVPSCVNSRYGVEYVPPPYLLSLDGRG